MPGGFFFLADSLTGLLAVEAGEVISRTEDQLREQAELVKAYAQENAPWSDRTGAARAGLDTEVSREGTEVVLTLFHTVEYGQWLETINSGEFAIIMPTLEALERQIMESVGAVEVGGLE